MDRLPPLDPGTLTPEQRQAAFEFRTLRGSDVFGPFVPLLRSPELLTRVSALGEYLRFRSAVPPRLSELAILVTARHWHQTYEWGVHAGIAARVGVARATLKAIADGRRPRGLPEDEQAVYDLCAEVHQHKAVSDEVFARARAALGEQGLVELLGLCGYYAMLAMLLNAIEGRAPGDDAPEFTMPAS